MSSLRLGFTQIINAIYAISSVFEKMLIGPYGITFGGLTGSQTNQTALTDYEEYDHVTNINEYPVQQSPTVKLIRAGTLVVMQIFSTELSVQSSIGSLLTFSNPLPSRFRPTSLKQNVGSIPVVNNNAGKHGIISINTSGNVQIGQDGLGDANNPQSFSGVGDSGYLYTITASWTLI
jgi:hypothetical protein